MDRFATLTSKGQITIPKDVRDALELQEGDRVLFRVREGVAEVTKIPDFLDLAGSVPVPLDKKGASWDEIREEAWRLSVRK